VRRILLVLSVALVTAALVAASAVPAMALNTNQYAQGCGIFANPHISGTKGCPTNIQGPPYQTGFGGSTVVTHCRDTTEQHVIVYRGLDLPDC
jgi:hypothetical protein